MSKLGSQAARLFSKPAPPVNPSATPADAAAPVTDADRVGPQARALFHKTPETAAAWRNREGLFTATRDTDTPPTPATARSATPAAAPVADGRPMVTIPLDPADAIALLARVAGKPAEAPAAATQSAEAPIVGKLDFNWESPKAIRYVDYEEPRRSIWFAKVGDLAGYAAETLGCDEIVDEFRRHFWVFLPMMALQAALVWWLATSLDWI